MRLKKCLENFSVLLGGSEANAGRKCWAGLFKIQKVKLGGEGGIRTHGTPFRRSVDFGSTAFVHSATSPDKLFSYLFSHGFTQINTNVILRNSYEIYNELDNL